MWVTTRFNFSISFKCLVLDLADQFIQFQKKSDVLKINNIYPQINYILSILHSNSVSNNYILSRNNIKLLIMYDSGTLRNINSCIISRLYYPKITNSRLYLYIPYFVQVNCDTNYKFRTIDGTCNNIRFPLWGSSNKPFDRLLPPLYGDGQLYDVIRQLVQNNVGYSYQMLISIFAF